MYIWGLLPAARRAPGAPDPDPKKGDPERMFLFR